MDLKDQIAWLAGQCSFFSLTTCLDENADSGVSWHCEGIADATLASEPETMFYGAGRTAEAAVASAIALLDALDSED